MPCNFSQADSLVRPQLKNPSTLLWSAWVSSLFDCDRRCVFSHADAARTWGSRERLCQAKGTFYKYSEDPRAQPPATAFRRRQICIIRSLLYFVHAMLTPNHRPIKLCPGRARCEKAALVFWLTLSASSEMCVFKYIGKRRSSAHAMPVLYTQKTDSEDGWDIKKLSIRRNLFSKIICFSL